MVFFDICKIILFISSSPPLAVLNSRACNPPHLLFRTEVSVLDASTYIMILRSVSTLVSLFVLNWIFASTGAVRVYDDSPLDSKAPEPGSRFCVVVDERKTVCADNSMRLRRLVDSPEVIAASHLGVPQRIDGTEAEQTSIKQVIRLMNLYWYEEVLSNDDFAGVRQGWYVFGLRFAPSNRGSSTMKAISPS